MSFTARLEISLCLCITKCSREKRLLLYNTGGEQRIISGEGIKEQLKRMQVKV